MRIRKAVLDDLETVERIYEKIHDEEERGRLTTGWLRNVYPTRKTAEEALRRDDLYVLEDQGNIFGTAIINQLQGDIYKNAHWRCETTDENVCVLHTLAIDPESSGNGYGQAFVKFYEMQAEETGCTELRMDTNEKNKMARGLYHKLGYEEVDILPTTFNGIPDVHLVMLEKQLRKG